MVLSLSTWTLNLSLFKSRNRERGKTLSLSVVAGYYGTDDGKPTQSLHTRKEISYGSYSYRFYYCQHYCWVRRN